MKLSNYIKILFLLVGTLTILEFIFIRGMFTWMISVVSVIIVGTLNVAISIKEKKWLQAYLYTLSSIALCMGYFVII